MEEIRKDYTFFEGWARKNRMKPICRIIEKGGDILIADSGESVMNPGDDGVLRKVYVTAFAIERDKAWIASTNETAVDDPAMVIRTPRGAQEYRVAECLEYARKALRETLQVRLYTDRGDSRIAN